jgi:small subunit ribosomal protein S4
MVYRLGFSTSRKEARQLVNHGHIAVNGRKVNTPSFIVKAGDEIAVRDKELFSVKNALESVVRRGVPSWIVLDKDNAKGVIKLLPSREDITMPIKEQLIVEYYSR